MESTKKEPIDIMELWSIIVKQRKLIVGLVFLSLIIAVAYYAIAPRIYQGSAVLRMPTFESALMNISAKDIIDIIGIIDSEKKQRLIKNNEDRITDVKLTPFRNSNDKLEIIIEAREPDVIGQSLDSMLKEINSIRIVKSTIRDEQERLLARSSELSAIIKDSAKLLATYDRLLKEGKLVPVGFNPVELHKKISDLKIEKLMMDQSVKRLDGGLQIARELEIKNGPVKPRLIKSLFFASLSSLLLGIFTAFALEFVKKS